MIRTTRRSRALLGAVTGLTLSLVAAGCGDDTGVTTDDTAEETEVDQVETPPTEVPLSPGDDETAADGEETDQADLTGAEAAELRTDLTELNGSGATGVAQVDASDDGQVLVTIQATELAAAPHAQHIHIGGENTCPTMDDAGDDDILTVQEGGGSYGEIAVSLTVDGDTDPGSGLAVDRFPTADDEGTLSYSRTFELPEGTTVDDLSNGVIVVHGVADTTLGEDPEAYDGEDSDLQEGLPQEATLPALCGALESVDGATGADTGTETETETEDATS